MTTVVGRPGSPQAWLVHSLAVSGVGLGLLVLVLKAQDGSHSAADIAVGSLAGFLFLGAGAVAQVRRSQNRIGLLMVLVGLSWFAEDLLFSRAAVVYTLGLVLSHASSAFAVHLVLAFPTGRLTSRIQRWLTTAAYAVAFGPGTVGLLFFNSRDFGPGHPVNLLLIKDDLGLVQRMTHLLWQAGIVVALGVVIVLTARWARAAAPMRRVLLPVFGTGVIGGAASAIGGVAGYDGVTGEVGLWIYKIAFCLLPLGFLAGVLRLRVGRPGIDGLLIELGRARSGNVMRDLLARALRDPALEVGYWQESSQAFTDGQHRRLVFPAPDSHRMATIIESDGRRIAALVHDRALTEDRSLLEVVTVVATLALERQRLAAEVHSQLTEVQDSRSRIVAATDAERRRVERDLHDGAQQRLVLTAMTLGEATERLGDDGDPELARLLAAGLDGVNAAITELRELARGIHPAILTDSGLGPAIEAMAHRMPVPVDLMVTSMPRLAASIETTAFYVVAEALTNAVKHAAASYVRIRLRYDDERLELTVADDGVGGAAIGSATGPGTGLLGLRDRLASLGGELTLQSVTGLGTTVSAVLPSAVTSGSSPS